MRLRTFLGLCGHLGVPVVADKAEKGNCISFLGVTLDTCLGLVRSYTDQKHLSVFLLESLAGLLNFACLVVVLGRPFLRRLYSLK